MTYKFCILLLALVAVSRVAGQSEDIPIENDNQFPPETPVQSASGTGELPITAAFEETTPNPEMTAIMPEGTPPVPVETQSVPEETTSVPEVVTTLSEETPPVPEVTPPVTEETSMPEVTTFMPEVTTFMPEETTIVAEETTAIPEDATPAPLEITTASEETVLPEETQIATEVTTPVPEETSVSADTTIVFEGPTTTAPELTTVPEETTFALEETTTMQPIGEVKLTAVIVPDTNQSCPNPCLCQNEEGTENFVVDCSGRGLTEFPSPIDSKTTILNLQNNSLYQLPIDVASLKKLKVLNASNNIIMDLAPGSISDLPQLTVLNLGNNKLIMYPKELQNSSFLTKLEELDLGGNEIRVDFPTDILEKMTALQKLTLRTSTPELLKNACTILKDSLKTVCTESCNNHTYECANAETTTDEDLNVVLPAAIPFEETPEPTDKAPSSTEVPAGAATRSQTDGDIDAASMRASLSRADINTETVKDTKEQVTDQEKKQNLDVKKEESPDVAVGATTADDKSGGGVSKSVIGVVVASMVVIVAIISIVKNWTSIKKRFSSSPRPAERGGISNGNGMSPEEVPLQDKNKSPV